MMFCRECDYDKHFLHRTNDLRIFFLKITNFHREKYISDWHGKLIEALTLQKEMVGELIQSCLKLVGSYDQTIQEVMKAR